MMYVNRPKIPFFVDVFIWVRVKIKRAGIGAEMAQFAIDLIELGIECCTRSVFLSFLNQKFVVCLYRDQLKMNGNFRDQLKRNCDSQEVDVHKSKRNCVSLSPEINSTTNCNSQEVEGY